MDVTGMTELSLAGWKGHQGHDLGVRMLRHAAQQDAAVAQLVAAAVEGQPPAQSPTQNGLGKLVDVSI
ncbi:hypothetical protein [Magnetospirillum gryphiswaldense]|uniref:Uncharacterized protein n=2 Tax=Magnetospirillum gryphiswaldense TaxID=55518 RepID=V6F8B6_MAGGM|nr:hypothetical protein [Magnetospirillum gryphiswaldense]AVM75196.1 hypothetical protein MSR1_27260 [Magnetospirillum gryphiswaldense MSR-1]AVM79099.1 hypothetical protein MSR1L_27260 [Magnetospirillum gryphiswaldense]CAM75603.1 hypothetical protein MGR_0512 [Magnetospirillum gryphiswaldense MSR-1]CDL00808.1 conserved protein of unknown function [Magnetospirillum gryphiswaldense MSR-1 v2]